MQGNEELGLIHVYTGEGKGKTTAAMGLALRALGHDLKVCVIQFMKAGGYTGELIAFKGLEKGEIEFRQYGKVCPCDEKIREGVLTPADCPHCFTVTEEDKQIYENGLRYAREVLSSEEYDLVILDEINNALSKNLVPLESVLEIIKNRNPETELVLTGRDAPKELVELADYVTQMTLIKHPMEKGTEGRRGIEY